MQNIKYSICTDDDIIVPTTKDAYPISHQFSSFLKTNCKPLLNLLNINHLSTINPYWLHHLSWIHFQLFDSRLQGLLIEWVTLIFTQAAFHYPYLWNSLRRCESEMLSLLLKPHFIILNTSEKVWDAVSLRCSRSSSLSFSVSLPLREFEMLWVGDALALAPLVFPAAWDIQGRGQAAAVTV